jgi:LasA protease
MSKRFLLISLIGLNYAISGCVRSAPISPIWKPSIIETTPTVIVNPKETITPSFHLLPTRMSNSTILSPTPDDPRVQPTPRREPEQYTVIFGDTLGKLSNRFSISQEQLIQANDLKDPNSLYVGQILEIPIPLITDSGVDFKIIPDSELVFGPMSLTLNLNDLIRNQGGYLSYYVQEIDGKILDGAQIITLASQNYSVNPRLLLAILEFRSGWLSNPQPGVDTLDHPLGIIDDFHTGLYKQLTWAADTLNRGYYLWKVNAINSIILSDGTLVGLSPTINPGTAAVQYLFANLDTYSEWREDVSSNGFFKLYQSLFGYPFDLAIEPLVPEILVQPEMILPFEENQVWSFTGGPHGGWDTGSGWAALDFAPPGEAQGCVLSNSWITTTASGLIVRAENGVVIQDLDGDGYEQTGWVILYLHVDSFERVTAGTNMNSGDRIGHPSCEGGVSNGTHLHIARRFNGEWIPADGPVPFVLDGWVSSGTGVEYDGFLVRDGNRIEAINGVDPSNQIQR